MTPPRLDEAPVAGVLSAFLLVGAAWFFGVRALGEGVALLLEHMDGALDVWGDDE